MITFNRKNIISSIIVLVSLLLLQNCATVKVIPDKTFNNISNYEFGQDRTKLTEFSNLLDSLAQKEDAKIIAEENMLDFLQTDATFASKQFVCRELREIATGNSIPVLVNLLQDEETTSIAKYALQNIISNKVDDRLIELLPNSSKNIQLAILDIFGSRKSKNAVSEISKLLNNNDVSISTAAASALGKIATLDCIKYFKPYLNYKNSQLRNTILDSYLSVADNLLRQNKKQDANKIYTDLYKQNLPFSIKQATLIGIINSANNKADEILKRINSEPDNLKAIAISKIRELPKDYSSEIFAKLLPTLNPANQIQLLSVFEDVKVKDVKPFVLEILNSDIPEVRIAAIKTIGNIGSKNEVLTLAEIAATKTGNESKYAELALELLQGNEIDETIISAIPSSENNVKAELIKSARTRLITSAFNAVIRCANSDNKKIRTEAIKTLAEISTDRNLGELLSLLSNQNNSSVKKKVERAISKVLVNYPNSNNAPLLIKNYKTSNNIQTKISLLRLLGFTSDKSALQLLRNETKNNNEEIKIAAVQGLSNWTTPEPMNDLKIIMQSDTNKKLVAIALKGFVKFISINEYLTSLEKVNLYKEALPFAKTSNERNLILDGVGHTDCFESLEVIKPYINQIDVKQTVDDCVNRVSWHLHQKDPERVKGYVNWFLSKIKDEKFQKKNKFLLDVIDKFIKNRDANLK